MSVAYARMARPDRSRPRPAGRAPGVRRDHGDLGSHDEIGGEPAIGETRALVRTRMRRRICADCRSPGCSLRDGVACSLSRWWCKALLVDIDLHVDRHAAEGTGSSPVRCGSMAAAAPARPPAVVTRHVWGLTRPARKRRGFAASFAGLLRPDQRGISQRQPIDQQQNPYRLEPFSAFPAGVGTGSRQGNASNQKSQRREPKQPHRERSPDFPHGGQ